MQTQQIYEILPIGKKRYVIKELIRADKSKIYPSANFHGTGKALCGILKKSERLEKWAKRKKERLMSQTETEKTDVIIK